MLQTPTPRTDRAAGYILQLYYNTLLCKSNVNAIRVSLGAERNEETGWIKEQVHEKVFKLHHRISSTWSTD